MRLARALVGYHTCKVALRTQKVPGFLATSGSKHVAESFALKVCYYGGLVLILLK